MSRLIIKVFVFILLMNQVVNILGKLTTLNSYIFRRGSAQYSSLICFSENDGGALVWNANLNYTNSYYRGIYIIKQAKQFFDTCTLYSSEVDCKLNNESYCLNSWEREYWKLTNSIDTPMGPVFDQRWEEFEENSYIAKTIYHIELLNTNTIVLPFSIRATKDVHVLICNEGYKENLCYWVIIGGWENTKSVIRKCLKGMSNIGVYSAKNSECTMERDYLYHTPLAEFEWRTFVLMWNSETRNISLYDSNQLIVTYRDTEVYKNTNYTYKLYIRSSSSMLIRYHNYSYLYTNTKNAILTSNIFYMSTENLCLQMLIGLCAQCDADISLHTSTNKILKTITVKGSSVAAFHGLPVWQPVKISNITTYTYDGLKIVVTPKLNRDISNPMWAIANIRRCPSDGCLRQNSMYIYQDWDNTNGQYFWPNMTCQKLFYKEQSVVPLFNNADLNVELDDKNCSVGYIGPACKLNCNSALHNIDCKNVVICNVNGCTCTSGYRGAKCNISCDNNFYGHACKNRCGSCSEDKQCDPISGVCHNGCRNMENYFYIPPLCQIGIGAPKEPGIFTNHTTIVATVPMKWEKEYEGIDLRYKFNIERLDGKFVKQHEWKRISQNSTKLQQIFENLEHGPTYVVQCIFFVNQSLLYGEWKNVDTHCDLIKIFRILPDETSLKIITEESGNQLYPCPMNSYILLLRNNDNQQEIRINGLIPFFPYTLSNLTSYTSYNVTIFNKKRKLFFEEICTLEGVPSKVLFLEALPLSSTNVSLFWASPQQTNGVIKEYVIQLTIIEYFGCKNIRPLSPSNYTIVKRTNKTDITLSGLHVYAKYNVHVTAHNSRHSSKSESTTFSLPESTIPVVTFSQVKMEDWILSWKQPEDCTAILGPLTTARIEILGISDAVKNFNITMLTMYSRIDLKEKLHGAEHYVAKIFASRGYDKPINISAYKEYEFKTPPKAPPNVINLEIVEVQNYETVHLRWQSPLPPLNGVLRGYDITICPYEVHRLTPCKVIEVELNETCNLWDNYMCKSIRYTNNNIEVVAYNKGVPRPSPPVNVTIKTLHNIMPDPPHNLTFTIHNNSIVDFKWLHPWRTVNHVRCFHIIIEEISSTLRSHATRFFIKETHDFTVTHYLRSYSLRLYLLPSTQYNISIQTVTITNQTSNTNFLKLQTPSSIDIDGELEVLTQESDSIILLHIPKVLNDTRDSVTYIGIEGPDICKQRVKLPEDLLIQAGEERIEYVSQIVKNSTSQLTGQIYPFGDDQSTNCSLKDGELYKIVVIITECDSSGERFVLARKKSFYFGGRPWVYQSEVWLICIILIIAVACAIYYFYKK